MNTSFKFQIVFVFLFMQRRLSVRLPVYLTVLSLQLTCEDSPYQRMGDPVTRDLFNLCLLRLSAFHHDGAPISTMPTSGLHIQGTGENMAQVPRFLRYRRLLLVLLPMALSLGAVQGFFVPTATTTTTTLLYGMQRPLLDQLASALFSLENERVERSSEVDEKGRTGEPMAWSEQQSFANKFSQIMATRAYGFKQFVADIVAGDYDKQVMDQKIDALILQNDVAMFSFTTCPFCRRAKDALEERGVPYQTSSWTNWKEIWAMNLEHN